MYLLLFVLEPLLVVNVVLWEMVGESHLIAAGWAILAVAMPFLARWVKN